MGVIKRMGAYNIESKLREYFLVLKYDNRISGSCQDLLQREL